MAPRSTLDASKLVLTTGAGCLVFARAHLGFVPWEFVPSVFSAFGSSIWGTSTGRSSTLTDLAFCTRSEEHTSELQSRQYLVCRLLLEKKKKKKHSASNNRYYRLYATACDASGAY